MRANQQILTTIMDRAGLGRVVGVYPDIRRCEVLLSRESSLSLPGGTILIGNTSAQSR